MATNNGTRHAPVTVQHGGPKSPREYAHCVAGQGVALLAHAFNVCDNPDTPYRYSAAARARFLELAAELYRLVEEGEIVELPHVIARKDERFQAFMGAALKKPRRRRAVA